MKPNVGKLDQTIRYIVTIVLVVAAVLINPYWTWAWFLLIPAVILAFTAGISWCALYQLLGINTCKRDT